MNESLKQPEGQGDQDRPLRWFETVGSVLAAFFGVQSSDKRRRDFTRGRPAQFIIVGLLMTAAFVGAVLLAVRLALKAAG